MVLIKMPRPIRWFWGSLGAYWLADIINPGFFSVSIMALLMLCILVADLYLGSAPKKADSPETPTQPKNKAIAPD